MKCNKLFQLGIVLHILNYIDTVGTIWAIYQKGHTINISFISENKLTHIVIMNSVYILIALVIALAILFFPGKKKTQREKEVEKMMNIEKYVEETAEISHDLMNMIVMETNKHVTEKYKKPSYIIETIAAKKFVHPETKDYFYRCMFMVMTKTDFVAGFSVTVDIRIKPKVEVIGSTKQPIDVELPGDTTPYEVSDVTGKDFFQYELVKKKVVPTLDELEKAKIKIQ
tara:strand:+ start:1548 stop:2228 length:681 start_codon:yes stop_codon:yes gene_type:complete